MSDDIIERLNREIKEIRAAWAFETTALRAKNENLQTLLAEAHAALSWSILDGMDECIPKTCPKEYKFVCDTAGSIATAIGEE